MNSNKNVSTQQNQNVPIENLEDYWKNNINELEEKKDQLKIYEKELETIEVLLQNLPKKLKHKIMVKKEDLMN